MSSRWSYLDNVVSLAVLSGLILTVAGSQTASAQEIIVKNDAVETNATGFAILNDFNIGDQAGARLVMPCDGRIVGVLVGWFGSFPNVIFQTTHTALHIFEDGVFLEPGAELATVISPLLTSLPSLQPTINEYRTLDAALTIPIDIPVVEGEAIIVTLEFANPTNVFAGGPNVVRDVDGCTAEGNVLYSSSKDTWFDACSFIGGDMVFRLIVVCDVEGACCLPDGSCTDIGNEIECNTAGGSFQGVGTTCGGLFCPQPCPADVSMDGNVNVTDLLSLLGKWGDCGPPCPEDIDESGTVNVTDLLALLGAWGACP